MSGELSGVEATGGGSQEVPAGSHGLPVEDGSRIEAEYAGERAAESSAADLTGTAGWRAGVRPGQQPAALPSVSQQPPPGEVAAPPIAGHPTNLDEGLVRATPPDARALLVAAGVAALTLLALVLLALKVS